MRRTEACKEEDMTIAQGQIVRCKEVILLSPVSRGGFEQSQAAASAGVSSSSQKGQSTREFVSGRSKLTFLPGDVKAANQRIKVVGSITMSVSH